MRSISRYSNRKLYDKTAKHYVTLLDLGTTVRSGEEVQVLDHDTGADLTAVTLAQVIYAEQVKSPRLSVEVLSRVIREGVPAAAA